MFCGTEAYLNFSDAETRNWPIAKRCVVNYYTIQIDLVPAVFPRPHVPSRPVIISSIFLAYTLLLPFESSFMWIESCYIFMKKALATCLFSKCGQFRSYYNQIKIIQHNWTPTDHKIWRKKTIMILTWTHVIWLLKIISILRSHAGLCFLIAQETEQASKKLPVTGSQHSWSCLLHSGVRTGQSGDRG